MTKTAAQDRYDRMARSYDARWRVFSNVVYGWVLKHWPQTLAKNAHIVDLGCGTGAFLKRLAADHSDYKLTGLDAAEAMLETARNAVPKGTFIQADFNRAQAEKLPKADLYLCLNVLHHMMRPDLFVAQISQHCAENTPVFICHFAPKGLLMKIAGLYWSISDISYYRMVKPREFKKILREHDFEIVEKAILKPNYFWRLQIYSLRKTSN
jgi:2-polyprenyl-3-methyl-5-hydroxy-6-metoxy-1,4-benzoquinol methylase